MLKKLYNKYNSKIFYININKYNYNYLLKNLIIIFLTINRFFQS